MKKPWRPLPNGGSSLDVLGPRRSTCSSRSCSTSRFADSLIGVQQTHPHVRGSRARTIAHVRNRRPGSAPNHRWHSGHRVAAVASGPSRTTAQRPPAPMRQDETNGCRRCLERAACERRWRPHRTHRCGAGSPVDQQGLWRFEPQPDERHRGGRGHLFNDLAGRPPAHTPHRRRRCGLHGGRVRPVLPRWSSTRSDTCDEYPSGPRRCKRGTPHRRFRVSSLRNTTAPGTAPTDGARPSASVDFPEPEKPPTATRHGCGGCRSCSAMARYSRAMPSSSLRRCASR